MSSQPDDRSLPRLSWLCFVALLALAPGVLRAGMSNEVFVLQAVSAVGSGEHRVSFSDGVWTPSLQRLQWSLAGETAVVDPQSGAVVCTLRSASVTLRKHCRIQISFELDAGEATTEVTIQSAYLWFPELAGGVAQGQASASFAASDRNGDSVTLVGLGGSGVGILRAVYNGVAPDGVLFSNLVGQIYAGAGGAASGSQADPPSGYRTLDQAVSSMSLRIAFAITAGDRASGSCNYRFIPEPTCTDDADGDGTPDCLDDCPQDVTKIGPGACGCGVSDLDTDGDGVPDCLDGCPDDPWKTAPGACGCGQPDEADCDSAPDSGGGGGGGGGSPSGPPPPSAPGAPGVLPAGEPRLAPEDSDDDAVDDDSGDPGADASPPGDDTPDSQQPGVNGPGANSPGRNTGDENSPSNGHPGSGADNVGDRTGLNGPGLTFPAFAPCGFGVIPAMTLTLFGLLGGKRKPRRKAPQG